MTTRKEVYQVIDEERVYQDKRWNRDTTASDGQHSVTEWLVYMQDYLTEAMHNVSRMPDPEADQVALHNVRKIAAMAVACMEAHGALTRTDGGK